VKGNDAVGKAFPYRPALISDQIQLICSVTFEDDRPRDDDAHRDEERKDQPTRDFGVFFE
jgi:hypothetical protein